MLAFARIGLGLAGLLCLAIAAIFDLEFVGRHVAADGAVTPGQAAALPAARLALAGLGLLVLAVAAFLERILAAPWLDRFLSSRRRVEWTIFLAPLVILIALAGYKLVRGPGDPFYLLAVREDSLVEWLTALAFFAGVVASCLLVKKTLPGTPLSLSAYYALLAAFCLFVGLEEISYGQRLLGFATPQPVAARNVQNDMTIHNMDVDARLVLRPRPADPRRRSGCWASSCRDCGAGSTRGWPRCWASWCRPGSSPAGSFRPRCSRPTAPSPGARRRSWNGRTRSRSKRWWRSASSGS